VIKQLEAKLPIQPFQAFGIRANLRSAHVTQ